MKHYEKSAGVFLDLPSCSSSIRWGVSVAVSKRRAYRTTEDGPRRQVPPKAVTSFDFEIAMTDCTRTIKWDGDCSPRLTKKKLRTAIRAFQQALTAVQAAEKVVRRLKAQK